MILPSSVEYPIVAIGDTHGQFHFLDNLLQRLRTLPEWPSAKLVFLGDLVDRGPAVKETMQMIIDLIRQKPGSTCVMGNHDYGLVRAARLDDGPESDYWINHYAYNYDHNTTFQSYLNRLPDYLNHENWLRDLRDLRDAIPPDHRAFLAGLPWVVEASGHLFLHNGLSPDLTLAAEEQVQYLHQKRWDSSIVPKPGTQTEKLWQLDYPVWLGADRTLSKNPLPFPGKTQVSGHIRLDEVDASPVRIRIDTSGGRHEPLTGCLLRSPDADPVFIYSNKDE